jgi:hypothetical protein
MPIFARDCGARFARSSRFAVRQRTLVATLALSATLGITLGVAGCAAGTGRGAQVQASGGAVPPVGEATGGPPPLPDVSVAPPSLTPVAPVAGTKNRRVHWKLAGRGDSDRSLLVDVAIGGPPCDAVTGVEVVESAATVTVTVYAGTTQTEACTRGMPARIGTARVRVVLDQPLGSRTLVDGAAG